MKTLRKPASSELILRRVHRVGPNSVARWGVMTPPQMLAHLVESLRMATGELPTQPKKTPLRFFPLKQLAIYVAPLPKKLLAARELLPESNPDMDESKKEIKRLLDDFREVLAHKALPEHPSFGRLGSHPWGVLMWKHLDHHLRQFGV